MTRPLGLLAALLVLAACGSAPSGAVPSGSAPSGTEASLRVGWTRPLVMVGWWRVEGTDQVVGFDPALVEVHGGGAVATGAWTADTTGRFLADVGAVASVDGDGDGPGDGDDAGDGAGAGAGASAGGDGAGPAGAGAEVDPVPAPGPPGPDRLLGATRYAVDGVDRVLTSPDGTATRLVPAPPPDPAAPVAVDPARPPTDAERRAAEPAADLPDGLVPAVDLTGRWVPEGGPPGPSVEFAADGSWTGSDGCNGTGGRHLLGDDGAFLAVGSSVTTLVGCVGVDVAAQLAGARRAALDGAVLVLLDPTGAVTGRFVRG